MGASQGSNKIRWKEIEKKTHKCGLCKPHGGENRRRRVKPDRYKNKNRKMIRKESSK